MQTTLRERHPGTTVPTVPTVPTRAIPGGYAGTVDSPTVPRTVPTVPGIVPTVPQPSRAKCPESWRLGRSGRSGRLRRGFFGRLARCVPRRGSTALADPCSDVPNTLEASQMTDARTEQLEQLVDEIREAELALEAAEALARCAEPGAQSELEAAEAHLARLRERHARESGWNLEGAS